MTTILPDPATLAAEVRDTSLADVADLYGVTVGGVAKRLNLGGYTNAGNIATTKAAAPIRPVPKRADETWMEQRACDEYTADFFYPEGPGKAAQEAEAKSICAACPVRVRCLEWALAWDRDAGYAWGVHGGLNGDERRELRRKPVSA